jgi:hypothetical protein
MAGVLVALIIVPSSAAFACGGLVAPGHAEVLQKATSLAGWHAGYEHYVTGFKFSGGAESFGYIIPLPGDPSKIQKGGDWTLERLEREIQPPFERAALAFDAAVPLAKHVTVLQQVKIEALDITIVRGGGRDVAAWAEKNGFDLTPDTPQVLGQYSSAGAVFALAKFDRKEAVKRGLIEGQGATIHFTIPTKAPWIPLRILALGKTANERVDADLFVLTDDIPSLYPLADDIAGMEIVKAERASDQLLADLRSDKGMTWLPAHGMWFTALGLHTKAGSIHSDLSINGGGPVFDPAHGTSGAGTPTWAWWMTAAVLVALLGMVGLMWRSGPEARTA